MSILRVSSWRRIFGLVLVLALLVAACGGGEADTTEPDEGGEQPTTTQPADSNGEEPTDGVDEPPDDEIVTITMWDWWVEADAQSENIQMLRDRFMDEHPNIVIESRAIAYGDYADAVVRAALAGELPDLLTSDVNMTVAWADAGIVADITDRMEEAGLDEVFFEGRFSAVVSNDRIYGVPNSSNTLGLYYNEDLLQEAGLEPPTTWDEVYDAACALSDGSRRGLVVSAIPALIGYQWLPWLWQAGGSVDDLSSEAASRALQIWVDLVDDGCMTPDVTAYGHDDLRNQFVSGQAAMMVNGPWNLAPLRATEDLNWGVVPLPCDVECASQAGGENLSISATSENADPAWEFVSWLQQPEIALEWTVIRGGIPHRSDIADEPIFLENEPLLAAFIEQAQYMRPAPPEYGEIWPQVQEVMTDAIHGALVGAISVDAGLATAAEELDALFASLE